MVLAIILSSKSNVLQWFKEKKFDIKGGNQIKVKLFTYPQGNIITVGVPNYLLIR